MDWACSSNEKPIDSYWIFSELNLLESGHLRPTRRWEGEIEINFRKLVCDDGRRIEVAHECVECRADVLAVL
jgi:hypothetical protein